MGISKTLFSSDSGEWETPDWIIQAADMYWGPLTLDVAATHENAKCIDHYTKEDDGLTRSWNTSGTVWCNPPYGPSIKNWTKKAVAEARKGQQIVLLLPVRTDTAWFKSLAQSAGSLGSELVFINGRLRFTGKGSAPFPSMLVVLCCSLNARLRLLMLKQGPDVCLL